MHTYISTPKRNKKEEIVNTTSTDKVRSCFSVKREKPRFIVFPPVDLHLLNKRLKKGRASDDKRTRTSQLERGSTTDFFSVLHEGEREE